MTDTPVPEANTPDSQQGPLWLAVVPSLVLLAQQSAEISGSVKTTAENLGVAWALPHLTAVATGLVFLGSLVWYYRRALSRNRPWALWLKGLMPWNRSG